MSRYRFVLICILFAGALLLIWFNGGGSLKWVQRQNYPPLADEQKSPTDLADYANDSILFGEKISIDYNNSNEEEFLTLLQQANPQNDWVVSTNDPAVAKIIENPEAFGLEVIDELSDLAAIRLRIVNPKAAYPSLLGLIEREVIGVNFPIRQPLPPRTEVVNESHIFSGSFLEWLGGSSERNHFGAGVKVAVIDSGIDSNHPSLSKTNVKLNKSFYADTLGEISADNSHGTAIASVIAGQGDVVTGIAPAAEILSYRVTDREGISDSFTVASAILHAIEDGADVINISLGGEEGSEVLRRAVSYALEQGIPVVASVGNDGIGLVNYPAAYDGVIGVTSVGVSGAVANFSNFGDGVDFGAPGVGVLTASDSQDMANFSGTSISAAMVTGAIAMQLGIDPGLSPAEIEKLLVKFSNESGKPGRDKVSGHGVLSLARLENQNNPDYTDAAISGFYFDLPKGSSAGTIPFDVVIQNQGNTYLNNLSLDVNYLGTNRKFLIGGLARGEVRTEKLYVQGSEFGKELKISATLKQNDFPDSNSKNNQRISVFKF